MKIFSRKKYTLKFRKTYKHVDFRSWKEITDAALMRVLFKLCGKYDFEIISTKFQDSFSNSYITIKCNKEDKNLIFGEYCLQLAGHITDVSF